MNNYSIVKRSSLDKGNEQLILHRISLEDAVDNIRAIERRYMDKNIPVNFDSETLTLFCKSDTSSLTVTYSIEAPNWRPLAKTEPGSGTSVMKRNPGSKNLS